MNEITTKRGCFNCSQYSKCAFSKATKLELTEILIHPQGNTPYRFGCCCGHYLAITKKEQVQFT